MKPIENAKDKIQADEIYSFFIEALKSGTSLAVIVNELGAAIRYMHQIHGKSY